MGGISESRLLNAGVDGAASWRGNLRVEGGGFCGMRTLPFETPMNLSTADGMYVTCRLASDDEASRRVWKMTLRTSGGERGEVVYQTMFQIDPKIEGLQRILLPFSAFRLVRGPRLIPGAPLLDADKTGTVFQVGLTASKFQIAEDMTPLGNFRDGFFQLDIGAIGTYTRNGAGKAAAPVVGPVGTATPEEAKKQRPLLFKVLLPVLNVFFGEKVRRGKRATEILNERGTTFVDRMAFGVRTRHRQGRNWFRAFLTAPVIPLRGFVGFTLGLAFRVAFLPFKLLKVFKPKEQNLPSLEAK